MYIFILLSSASLSMLPWPKPAVWPSLPPDASSEVLVKEKVRFYSRYHGREVKKACPFESIPFFWCVENARGVLVFFYSYCLQENFRIVICRKRCLVCKVKILPSHQLSDVERAVRTHPVGLKISLGMNMLHIGNLLTYTN